MENCTGLEIAVIGMSGRFPGAGNINEFWDNLRNGVESISFFSDAELDRMNVKESERNNPNYVRSNGGILEQRDYFDADFFGYSPREAEVMDPQMRLLHECTWEALDDAGYDPDVYQGTIGIFAGSSANFYWSGICKLSRQGQEMGEFSADQLIDRDFLVSRIAYKVNLKGPSCLIQTSCSTSLAAVHTACRALLLAECDIALAGGVSLRDGDGAGYFYQEGMIASQDGHCRAFDRSANGTVRGEGVGMVVLKPLAHAVKDGDNIYAVIKGSALNNDGYRKAGFTSPSIIGQAEVVKAALRISNVPPETIGYIETHGTGTALGDVIEISALKKAFAANKKKFCAIGSVKTNIGHLDAAAGIAGLIKTILSLKYRIIPPSLHFETPNKEIDFKDSPFYVNTQTRQWDGSSTRLRAGVNSVGIGGTNVHLVVEAAPAIITTDNSVIKQAGKRLIVLSAKSASALEKMNENLIACLKRTPSLCFLDLVYTLQSGRRSFPHRQIALCSDVQDVISVFSKPGNVRVRKSAAGKKQQSIVFMFPGVGCQYPRMGLDLYNEFHQFACEMDKCFEIVDRLIDYRTKGTASTPYKDGKNNSNNNSNKEDVSSPSITFITLPVTGIKDILYPTLPTMEGKETEIDECERNVINDFEISCLSIFIFEYSLARFLIKCGIEPDAMIGYSLGEFTAACLSGVFSLEDAIKIILIRSKCVEQTQPGVMLSVPLEKEKILPFLSRELSLAIDNGLSCVVAGPIESIRFFQQQMQKEKIMCVPMDNSAAIHSPLMDPILKDFETHIAKFKSCPNKIPFISNVTGDWISIKEARDPAYWAGQLGKTVQFAPGIKKLMEDEPTIFLEVGPGNSLSSLLLRYINKDSKHRVIHLIRNEKNDSSDIDFMFSAIGKLWLHGVKVNWSAFYENEKRNRISLPAYPFERKKYRLENNLNRLQIQLNDQQDKPFYLYWPSWKKTPFLTKPGNSDKHKQRCWLILSDTCGVAGKIAGLLKERGDTVVEVKRGKKFAAGGSLIYSLDPRAEDHYEYLFRELANLAIQPTDIIHLWGITGTASNRQGKDFTDFMLDICFHSLIYLAKALYRQSPNEKIMITAITDNVHDVTGEESLCPAKAAILGPLKVIPQEFPNIVCKQIDIMPSQSHKSRETNLIEQLKKEIFFESPGLIAAYRNNSRWIQHFEPFTMNLDEESLQAIKENGVYLIVGGTGNIGMALTESLIKSKKARVALTGKSNFPPRETWNEWLENHEPEDNISRKIKKMSELIESGGVIRIFSGDVADHERMNRIVNEIEKSWGHINGVIYAPGIVGGDTFKEIKNITKADCEAHFRSKNRGLSVMGSIFAGKEYDFFLVISSVSSILGGLKMAAYSAANCFIDALTDQHNKNNEKRWTCVDWDKMDPEDMVKVLFGILAVKDIYRFVVSTGAEIGNRIKQWVDLESIHGKEMAPERIETVEYKRPDLSVQYEPPRDDFERKMTDAWKDFLGFKDIGVNDDFFELGGDSLKAIQLVTKLQEQAVNVSVDTILAYQTIRKICDHIEKTSRDGYIKGYIKENEIGDKSEKSFAQDLQLINEISKKEKQQLFLELKKELKFGKDIVTSYKKEYPLSPVQKVSLRQKKVIAHNNEIFTYDFKYPFNDLKQIERVANRLLEMNPLLFSIIAKKNGRSVIREPESMKSVSLPFIDISHYSLKCRERLLDEIYFFLFQPFKITGTLLLRMLVVKESTESFKFICVLNHLIFDGESYNILRNRIDEICRGNELQPGVKLPGKSYIAYVQFLESIDYESIDLEQYVQINSYKETTARIKKKTAVGKTRYFSFEIDLSGLDDKVSNLYNELINIAYARMLSGIVAEQHLPMLFVSNGRFYKNGVFPNIIGDFHDLIPVLFDMGNGSDPGEMLQKFLTYRKFIRDTNFNFMNFLIKKQDKGDDYSFLLTSPFSFNALVGFYHELKSVQKDTICNEVSIAELYCQILCSKDRNSNQVIIKMIHNTLFDDKLLESLFRESLNSTIVGLDKVSSG